jgi:hypothetical protein
MRPVLCHILVRLLALLRCRPIVFCNGRPEHPDHCHSNEGAESLEKRSINFTGYPVADVHTANEVDDLAASEEDDREDEEHCTDISICWGVLSCICYSRIGLTSPRIFTTSHDESTK